MMSVPAEIGPGGTLPYTATSGQRMGDAQSDTPLLIAMRGGGAGQKSPVQASGSSQVNVKPTRSEIRDRGR
jgi:hypothetical protein